jgi:hypothetical protein
MNFDMAFYFSIPHISMGKLQCNSKLKFQSSSCKICEVSMDTTSHNVWALSIQLSKYTTSQTIQNFFEKYIQNSPLPFTKHIKYFQYFVFNFPNLPHHKPLAIFTKKTFKICLYHILNK